MQTTILPIDWHFPWELEKSLIHLISALPYQPIWQSIEWNKMIKKAWSEERGWFVGVFEEQSLLWCCILEKRSLWLSFYGLFSLGWPIVAPVCDTESVMASLTAAIETFRQDRSIVFVQLEPMIELPFPPWYSARTYKNFVTRRTAIVDLTKTEEEILLLMKPKWRYNIRLAERHGVAVTNAPIDEEHIDLFLDLLGETTERDRFAVNSRTFYDSFFSYIREENRWVLLFAKKDDVIVAAGAFCFFQKTALYYYGATPSDNEIRKLMGAYLLQWEAIREAKKRGCEQFDFLGIMGQRWEDKHLSGVTEFKLKLASNSIQWPATKTMIFAPILFWLLRSLKTIKKVVLRWS